MPIIPGAIVVPANIDDLSVTLEGARTLAQMYWYDPAGVNWDRAVGSAAGLLVDTELPAAALLAETMATPTTPTVGTANLIYNGATWDFLREGSVAGSILTDVVDRAARDLGKVDIAVFDTQITAADATVTPTTSPPVVGINMVYNGVTWDMMREGASAGSVLTDVADRAARDLGKVDIAVFDTQITAADATVTPTTSPPVVGINMVYNGVTWDMMREGASAGSVLTDVADRAARDLGKVDIAVFDTAITPADATVTPTTSPPVVSINMVYNGVTWDMLREGAIAGSIITDTELAAAVTPIDDMAPADSPFVLGALYGYEAVGGVWDRVHVDAAGNLSVGIVGSAVVDTELPAAAALTDNFVTPTAPAVGAFGMMYDGVTWDMMRGDAADGLLVNLGSNNDVTTELSAAAALTDDFANPTAGGVAAFAMVWDGAAWDRAPGTSADGLLVNLGANNDVDTELPAAAALADNMANPTTPLVGACNMIFDGATWDRVTVTALTDNFANPSVTGTGAFGMVWDGATWDRMPGDAADGVLVNLGANNDVTVTGSVTADTELPAAAALSDAFANPTAPGVGAFGMGYDGTDWERLRILQQPNALAGRAPGILAVGKTEGKVTYRVAFKGLVAAGAGVAVKIIGSASAIVRVTKVQIAKPSVAQAPLRMVKTSTAAGAADSTTPAGIPLDSANAAATAVVTLYTAVPEGGAEIGTGSVFEADVGTGDVVYEAFGDDQNTQALVLRGVAETLEINLSAGATIDGYIEWTEE